MHDMPNPDEVHKMKMRFPVCNLNNEQAEFLAYAKMMDCTILRGSRRPDESTETVRVFYDPEHSEKPRKHTRFATISKEARREGSICCFARWYWYPDDEFPKAKVDETKEQRRIYLKEFKRRYVDPEGSEFREDIEFLWYDEPVKKSASRKWFLAILDLKSANALVRMAINETNARIGLTVENETPVVSGSSSDRTTEVGSPATLQEMQDDLESRVQKSLTLTPESRRERLNRASKKPERVVVTTHAFVRNPDVIAEVLHRASGKCECCRCDAPFIRKSRGTPYLEVHHKQTLADGGEDTVENAEALCPNCHRAKHYA
jgi:predicted HNH restriction endonuclease